MWGGGINSPGRNVTSLVDQLVCTREEPHTIGTDKSGHVATPSSTLGLGSFELGQSLAVATRGDRSQGEGPRAAWWDKYSVRWVCHRK